MAVIRRICEEDARTVAELWNELAEGVLKPRGRRNIERYLALAENHADFACFVAEEDGELVGFTVAHRWTSPGMPGVKGEIAETYVRPSARGHEIGRGLVEHAVDWLRAHGAWAVVHDACIDAPGDFWESLGFERDVVRYSLYAKE